MGIFSGIVDGIDAALDHLGSFPKQSITDYCDLEAVDDEKTLVSKDGSLITLVEVRGMRGLMGGRDLFNQVSIPLTSALQGRFEDPSHQIQVWFEVDPDRTQEEIAYAQGPSRETAKRLNLDLMDLLDEREKHLVKWTAAERCFIALWTRPAAMSKSEASTEAKIKKKASKGKYNSKNAQNPIAGTTMIRNLHRSLVEGFSSELNSLGIVSNVLDARTSLREIRRSFDPSFTSNDWTPALPGDRLYPSLRSRRSTADEWEIMAPPLSWQLCSRDARIIDANVVEIGERIYAPLYIDLFPRDLKYFMSLFARAKEKGLPWRISYLMEGGGLSGTQATKLIAQLTGWASPGNNTLLARQLKDLEAFQNDFSGINVKIRVALCTWAPKGETDLLARRASDLARSVEGWGSCQVSESTGDPVSGFMSSTLAMTQGSIATRAVAPISDVFSMMPWSRPTSPWARGPLLLRSPDGKIIPYEPYSSLQSTWISLIFAKPGSGKSVLMNMHNLALCLLDGLQALPRIAIIDVGPSSSGLISLIKEALPSDQRHLAVHKRLRMVPEHSINPLDTQLGCRYPTQLELGFIRNFMTLLATDFNAKNPPSGIPGLVAAVLDEMYRARSDKGDPSRYTPGIENFVDEKLDTHGIHHDTRTSWWEMVDELFKVGEYHAAHIAQRHAVPIITDAITVAQGEKIKERYGDMVLSETGETIIQAFSRMLSDALSFFPILSRPTAFDLGEARIVALDLDEVAKGTGPVGERVSAVMYMLARQVLGKDFYINKESVGEIPAPEQMSLLRPDVPVAEYKAYHLQRIEGILKDPKRICYDEFHRTKDAQAVRDQVKLDMREGRKFRVDVILASQSLEDFDDVMIELSTSLFVMDGGNEITVAGIEQRFSFQSETERWALRNLVRPPGPGGGVFMSKFETKQGKYTMLLAATLGPIELWAFSTTAVDVSLRSTLYERMGPARARKGLALVYPSGSAERDIKNRQETMRESGSLSMDNKNKDVILQIAKEVEEIAKAAGI